MYDRDEDMKGKTIAIILILILIIAAVGYFGATKYGHHSDISIEVYSTHITETVDLTVYIDDEQVYSYKGLKPGEGRGTTTPLKYYFSYFDKSRVIEIKAVSTGGALGPQTDSETITVFPNDSHSVKLYI